VDFAFVLVLAQDRDNCRNIGESSDLYTYSKVMKLFIQEFPVPFSVLFNKSDLIDNHSAYRERLAWCDKFYLFPPPKSWFRFMYWQNLCREKYLISAKPTVRVLSSSCINELKNPTRKDKHIYFLSPKFKASYCDTCQCKCILDNSELWDVMNDPEIEGYKSIPPPSPPPTNIDEPLAMVIQSCQNDLNAVAIAKSISKSLEDKLQQSSNVIENIVCTASIWAEGPSTDSRLCDALANLFDLHYTGRLSSEYEKTLWVTQNTSFFGNLHKKILKTEADAIRNFLAVWGIFYAKKFYLIVHNSLANTSQEKIEEEVQSEREKVKSTYIAFLSQNSRKLAYDKFIKEPLH